MKEKNYTGEILTYLFKEMDLHEVDYCVLKNYETLPEILNSQDVDILINNKSIKKVTRILNKVKQQFHIKTIVFSRKGNVNRFELLESVHSHTFLIIEFWTGIDWYCFPMFSNKDMFEKKIKFKLFYIASPIYEILTCWLVPFMVGGKIKDRYVDKFFSVYNDKKEEVKSAHQRIWCRFN